jgi:hypothetical protein
MSSELLGGLKINHIGIVIDPGMREIIEKESGEYFIEDKVQGVSVCFVWDNYMKVFKEYITREGRAKNYNIGFSHICYDVSSQDAMNSLHKEIISKKIGIRLSLPEASPTKNCNIVTFYNMFAVGLVEYNIVNNCV